jgi:hypothetical protein
MNRPSGYINASSALPRQVSSHNKGYASVRIISSFESLHGATEYDLGDSNALHCEAVVLHEDIYFLRKFYCFRVAHDRYDINWFVFGKFAENLKLEALSPRVSEMARDRTLNNSVVAGLTLSDDALITVDVSNLSRRAAS